MPFLLYPHIVALTVGLEETNQGVGVVGGIGMPEQQLGIIEESDSLPGTVHLLGRKSREPIESASLTTMNLGNTPQASGEAPCVEEVEPIDVRRYFVYGEVQGMGHGAMNDER